MERRSARLGRHRDTTLNTPKDWGRAESGSFSIATATATAVCVVFTVLLCTRSPPQNPCLAYSLLLEMRSLGRSLKMYFQRMTPSTSYLTLPGVGNDVS